MTNKQRKALESEIKLQIIWLYMMDNPGEIKMDVKDSGNHYLFKFTF